MDPETQVDETQNDDAPANEQAVERPLSKREQQMAAIKVVRETDDEGGQDPAPARAPTAPAAKQDDQLAAQLNDEPPLLEDPTRARVRVKVDGEEAVISVADAIKNYQKQVAADRRLAEANRILHEARSRPLPPVGVDEGAPDADTANQSESSGDGKVSAKEFIASLFEGDEEKAAAALEKVLGTGRTNNSPTLNVEQLAVQLTPEIRQQLKNESALEQFTADNSDLAEDPYLTDLTNRHLDEEMDGGKPYHEALQAAATRTREWMASKGFKSKPVDPAPTTTRNSKLERKAAMDNINALNKTATTTVEPAKTASDVIADMRKARGMA